MMKKKVSYLLSTIFVMLNSTVVYATGGQGDVGAAIDTWGNTVIGLFLKIFKIGGIIAFISCAIFLFFNNDETNAKRAKNAMFVIIAALFVGWFAQPIYNTFVK